MHVVSLSFDDGFLKSNLRVAEIYEKHGLSACFNIVATGHLDSFVSPDEGQRGHQKGGFELWNELQDRGHEIMPHGYKHADKGSIPLDEAKQLILDCLGVFAAELRRFNAKDAVFNFPYNNSTSELEEWLPTVVKAFRTSGHGTGINKLPHEGQVKLVTTGFGPDNCEDHLDRSIADLLSRPCGWLIYNTHGVDGEGWGPIGSDYLDRLLDRLLSIDTLRILPTGRALKTRMP